MKRLLTSYHCYIIIVYSNDGCYFGKVCSLPGCAADRPRTLAGLYIVGRAGVEIAPGALPDAGPVGSISGASCADDSAARVSSGPESLSWCLQRILWPGSDVDNEVLLAEGRRTAGAWAKANICPASSAGPAPGG